MTANKKSPKKEKGPVKTAPMDLGNSPGVAPLTIPEIDNAIIRYQRAKDKRVNEETGERFYRGEDGRDYVLTETLKIVKVITAEPERVNVE